MMKLFSLVFLAACSIATSHHTTKCEQRFSMAPFDEQRFSGDWYVVVLGRPLHQRPVLTCVKPHYSTTGQGNDTHIEIRMDAKKNGVDVNMIFKGQPNVPGVNSVMQAVYKMEDETEWSDVFKLSVIGSDYDTFAVIHMCFETYDEKLDLFERKPSIQIWSRVKTLDATILKTLQTLASGFEDVTTEILDISDIIDNSGC